MTRRECDDEDKDSESGKNRRRRSGVVTTSPCASSRRSRSCDHHELPFPSVEELVQKYSTLISQQQPRQQSSLSGRVCSDKSVAVASDKCRSWKWRYFSSQTEGGGVDAGDAEKPENGDEGCVLRPPAPEPGSPATSDDGLWFLDVPDGSRKRCGSDSAFETLPESDEDKYPTYPRRRESDDESHLLTKERLPVKGHHHLRRRQTWTGPLLNEDDAIEEAGAMAATAAGRITARKTCSLEQSMRKLEYPNGLAARYYYSALRRKGSTFSNDDYDDDEIRYRYHRTPSVVISDHSDDPNLASSTVTLEEIEELQNCRLKDQMSYGLGDSSSDCSATSVWSNANNCTTILDNEYDIVECGRKISDCSTCSTFSCDEYDVLKKVRIPVLRFLPRRLSVCTYTRAAPVYFRYP